jgi:glycine dehydrogenase
MEMEHFKTRHIGINPSEMEKMLETIGVSDIDELIDQTIPADIRLTQPLSLPKALSEQEYAEEIAHLASKNKVCASYIGMGWYDTATPSVIYRNVFENPVWYTSYTPYQSEISQGRLEALLNFQTMVSDLTAMPLANSSLLDEATAAAEAANMMYTLCSRNKAKKNADTLFVDEHIFPQTLAVLRTRMRYTGKNIVVGDYKTVNLDDKFFGAIVQYPNSDGNVEDYRLFVEKAHAVNCKVAVATDLLALVMLTPPGEWGADIAFGSSQRFGIPMFYGGPSAAFFATRDEYKRFVPGRIIGISKDAYGKKAFRMALQTREQHIKREKATSNICTAQALLATMSSFYAVYHGPKGLKKIAERLMDYGYHAPTLSFPVHGTLMVEPTESESLAELDRFVDAMNGIYEEIMEITEGKYPAHDNALINAPHPEYECVADEWKHAYPRSKAVYPLPYVAENKFWVNVARIDDAFGDRNLVARLGEE